MVLNLLSDSPMFRRVSIFLIILSCCLGKAQGEVYFTDSERATVALLLRGTLALRSESNGTSDQFQAVGYLLNQIKGALNGEPRIVNVESFADFIEAQNRSTLFSQYRLSELPTKELIDKLKPVRYYSGSSSVLRKIQNYEQQRLLKYQKFLYFIGSRGLSVGLSDRSTIVDLREEFRRQFESNVQQMISSLSQSATSDVMVLSRLLKLYFNALPFEQKAEILYQISQMSLDSKPIDIFLVMIQNAGPQLQKLVQIMGRSEDIPDEFKGIFQRLESEVSAVPWWKVRKTLVREGIDLGLFDYFERRPIGVGTMAQTHRAQWISPEGRRASVALRFLKPGIGELLEMDHQILLKIASEIDADPDLKHLKLPALSELVEDIHRSVVEELSMPMTVDNQNEAAKVYSRTEILKFDQQKNTLKIFVPKATLFGPSKNVMIQELVFGKKPAKEFSEYKVIYPTLYRKVSERITSMWIEEAFFKSGFFHIDLHQGNMLASVNDSEIRVGILDYGMVGHLNKELRESAMMLALAIRLERSDLIAKYFLRLGQAGSSDFSRSQFVERIQEHLDLLRLKTERKDTVETWIKWAMDQGIKFEYEFLKLNRGLKAVQGMLVDSQSSETVYSLAIKMAIKNNRDVFGLLMSESDLKMKELTLAGIDALRRQLRGGSLGEVKGPLKCQSVFR